MVLGQSRVVKFWTVFEGWADVVGAGLRVEKCRRPTAPSVCITLFPISCVVCLGGVTETIRQAAGANDICP